MAAARANFGQLIEASASATCLRGQDTCPITHGGRNRGGIVGERGWEWHRGELWPIMAEETRSLMIDGQIIQEPNIPLDNAPLNILTDESRKRPEDKKKILIWMALLPMGALAWQSIWLKYHHLVPLIQACSTAWQSTQTCIYSHISVKPTHKNMKKN